MLLFILEGIEVDPASVIGIVLILLFFAVVMIYGLRAQPGSSEDGGDRADDSERLS